MCSGNVQVSPLAGPRAGKREGDPEVRAMGRGLTSSTELVYEKEAVRDELTKVPSSWGTGAVGKPDLGGP